jgi:hypothetical protein
MGDITVIGSYERMIRGDVKYRFVIAINSQRKGMDTFKNSFI